jgi:glycosidase
VQAVLQFWLDLGVDGFRVTSAQILLEDSDFRNDGEVPCDPPNTVSKTWFKEKPWSLTVTTNIELFILKVLFYMSVL